MLSESPEFGSLLKLFDLIASIKWFEWFECISYMNDFIALRGSHVTGLDFTVWILDKQGLLARCE